MRYRLLVALFLAIPLHAAVTGRVVDEDGAPIAGARVRAFPRETFESFYARALSASPEPVPVATVQSGTDGTFSFETKGNAVVDVLAEAAGKRAAYRIAVNGEEARTIMLRKGDRRRVRVTAGGKPVAGAVIADRFFVARTDASGFYETAEPDGGIFDSPWIIHPDYAMQRVDPSARESGEVREIVLTPGVTLRGRVVAEDGETGVASAIVSLDNWSLVRSSEDGSFAIPHAFETWRVLTARDGNRGGRATRASSAAYNIRLRPAGTISGTARNATNNTVVPGVLVWIRQDGDGSPQRAAVADAKGNFTISVVPAGIYSIQGGHPAYTSGSVELRVAPTGGRVQRDVVMTQQARISGTVVDEERKPVASAAVGLFFGGQPNVTAADGRFTLRLPSSQGIILVARKRGYAVGVLGPLTLAEGETKSNAGILLSRGFTFHLTVNDRAGNAVANEPVRIYRGGDDEEYRTPKIPICGEPVAPCRTGSDGKLALQLTESTYEISVGGAAAAVKNVAAQKVSPQTDSMTVVVDRAVQVSGRVSWTDGSPVTEGNVTVLAGESMEGQLGRSAAARAVVRSDGTFVLPNMAPGPVKLYAQFSAQPPGAGGAPVEVTAPAGDVILTIPRPLRIEGKVIEKATNQPVREFSVAVRRYRGFGMNSQSFVSDEGRFTLENIVENKLDIVVTAPGYAPGTLSNITAVAEGTEPLTVQLERGAKLVVRVTSEGRAVPDARVQITGATREAASPSRWQVTDAEGVFTFDSLAPGEYVVQVMKKGFAGARKGAEATIGKEAQLDIALSRGRELRGRVTDGEGRPVANARVVVRSGPSFTASGGARSLTDSEGMFTLEGMLDGLHTIAAEKNGYLPATAQSVDPAKEPMLTLTLHRGGTLTGRVTGVKDAELAAVGINVSGANTRIQGRPDASGNFTITGVPDGRVDVRAAMPGPQMRQTASKMVEVVNGSAPPVELEFVSGIMIRGRVTRDGAPVAMGNIAFVPAVRDAGLSPGSAQTRGDGTYDLSLSGTGEYRVMVAWGPAAPVETGTVNVSGPMTHDIAVTGGTLRGRVVDASTREPVAGALVELARSSGRGRGTATTDSEGRFSIDPLESGTYRVSVTKQRYAPSVETIEVRDNQASDVELRISSGQRTEIRVVDALDRRALDGGSITVFDGAKKVLYAGTLSRDGDGISAVWLMPGRYTARVWMAEYVPEFFDVSVPGPATTVAMRRSGRVIVKGTREGAVRARLINLQSGMAVGAVPLPPGIFENIAPGTYKVELLDQKQTVLDEKTAVVIAGETFTAAFH